MYKSNKNISLRSDLVLGKYTYLNKFIYILRLLLTIKDFLRRSVLHTGTLNFLLLRSCLWCSALGGSRPASLWLISRTMSLKRSDDRDTITGDRRDHIVDQSHQLATALSLNHGRTCVLGALLRTHFSRQFRLPEPFFVYYKWRRICLYYFWAEMVCILFVSIESEITFIWKTKSKSLLRTESSLL